MVFHRPVALLPAATRLAALAMVRGRFAARLQLAGGVHRALTPEPSAVLEQHELAGETTRTVVAPLAAADLGLAVLPAMTPRRITPRLLRTLHLLSPACNLAALLLFVWSVAQSGELVHRWEVRGLTEAGASP